MPRRRIAAALAAALLAALAGCGADTESPDAGPDAEQQVRAVVARFAIATRDKDYQEICDRLLSDTLVDKLEAVGLPCEGALQRGLSGVRAPTLEINEVSISRGRALVSVHTTAAGQPPSDDAVQLVLEGGDWKIASLAEPTGAQTQTTTTATTKTAPTTKTTKKGTSTTTKTKTKTTTTTTTTTTSKRRSRSDSGRTTTSRADTRR